MISRLFGVLLACGIAGCAGSPTLPPRPGPPDARRAAAVADHFIAFTDTPIETLLDRFGRAGFAVASPDQTVRVPPGLRNGFVFIGPDYLEFCWVEREEEFAEGVARDRGLRRIREGQRPYGIAFRTEDAARFREGLLRRGFDVPDVVVARPSDAPEDAPSAWAFGALPPASTPGAHAFYMAYLAGAGERPRVFDVGRNGIFLVVGAVFVAERPDLRTRAWARLFGEDSLLVENRGFALGPHTFVWVTPSEWERIAGRPYPVGGPFHEIAAVVVRSEDCARTEEALIAGGIPVVRRHLALPGFDSEPGLVVFPEVAGGFPMIVLPGEREPWMRWREAFEREAIDSREGSDAVGAPVAGAPRPRE